MNRQWIGYDFFPDSIIVIDSCSECHLSIETENAGSFKRWRYKIDMSVRIRIELSSSFTFNFIYKLSYLRILILTLKRIEHLDQNCNTVENNQNLLKMI